jgi:glutathione reductase (NADPH)
MTFDFDLFVIGAGSGGVRAARISAQHGARVAVAEEYRVGGTCVIRGCVPKKMLVYGAHFAEDLHEAASFGWDIEGAQASTGRACAISSRRMWRASKDSTLRASTIIASRFSEERATMLPDPILSASRTGGRSAHETILVATGAWPARPDVPGAELGITSNEIFHLETHCRARAVIAGAGYIANEFAGILHAFGDASDPRHARRPDAARL